MKRQRGKTTLTRGRRQITHPLEKDDDDYKEPINPIIVTSRRILSKKNRITLPKGVVNESNLVPSLVPLSSTDSHTLSEEESNHDKDTENGNIPSLQHAPIGHVDHSDSDTMEYKVSMEIEASPSNSDNTFEQKYDIKKKDDTPSGHSLSDNDKDPRDVTFTRHSLPKRRLSFCNDGYTVRKRKRIECLHRFNQLISRWTSEELERDDNIDIIDEAYLLKILRKSSFTVEHTQSNTISST